MAFRKCNVSCRIETLEPRLPLAASLVADLDTSPGNPINSENAVVAGDQIYFGAVTPRDGAELWSLDLVESNATQKMLALQSGIASSFPVPHGVTADGDVFFSATTADRGRQLWIARGSELTPTGGPAVIRNSSNAPLSVVLGNRLYYVAEPELRGFEVWYSDGTPEGTKKLGPSGGIERVQDQILIRDPDGTFAFDGQSLRKFDVKLRTGNYFSVNGSLFLHERHGGRLLQLDLANAKATEITNASLANRVDGKIILARDRQLLAFDPTNGEEYVLAEGVKLRSMHRVGDQLLILEQLDSRESIAWTTDGTVDGTRQQVQALAGRVADVFVAENRSYVWTNEGLLAAEASASFRTILPFAGSFEVVSLDATRELVFTDDTIYVTAGTPETTLPLTPSTEIPLGPRFVGKTATTGQIVFTAQHPEWGEQLWVSDGTVEGTVLQTQLPSPTRDFVTSFDQPLVSVGDNILAVSSDTVVRIGQPGETVTPLVNRSLSRFGREYGVTSDRAYFPVLEPAQLLETDGTLDGTRAVWEGDGEVVRVETHGRFVYFQVSDLSGQSILQLEVGKEGVTELWSGDSAAIRNKKTGESNLYITVDNQLWAIDALGGQEKVPALNLPGVRLDQPTLLETSQQYFYADREELGTELWRTDGTVEGTRQVVDLLPGAAGSNPTIVHQTAEHAYFWATTSQGTNFWISDGTADGTYPLLPQTPDIGLPVGTSAVMFQGRLYFDGIHDQVTKIWSTDGSPSGTRLLTDDVGFRGTATRVPQVAYGSLYFSGQDSETGLWQLWNTDGTTEGTRIVQTSADTDTEFTEPARVVRTPHRAFLLAADVVHGREIWELTPEPLDGDLDGDGKVGFADFLTLSANFGLDDATPRQGDVDQDGTVSFEDFLRLSENFGRKTGRP